MRIVIASDHGGFELKEHVKGIMDQLGTDYEDLGTDSIESVDYPDYAFSVAHKVAKGEADKGILICGTGIGMSIAANKVEGIRAALVHDCYTARVTRQHNDSNVLCLGGRTTGFNVAEEIVKIWLSEDFEGGRHERRVQKIIQIESKRGND